MLVGHIGNCLCSRHTITHRHVVLSPILVWSHLEEHLFAGVHAHALPISQMVLRNATSVQFARDQALTACNHAVESDSVWTGTVLAAFIYVMGRDTQTKNTSVGAIEAAQGMATLISAVPVG